MRQTVLPRGCEPRRRPWEEGKAAGGSAPSSQSPRVLRRHPSSQPRERGSITNVLTRINWNFNSILLKLSHFYNPPHVEITAKQAQRVPAVTSQILSFQPTEQTWRSKAALHIRGQQGALCSGKASVWDVEKVLCPAWTPKQETHLGSLRVFNIRNMKIDAAKSLPSRPLAPEAWQRDSSTQSNAVATLGFREEMTRGFLRSWGEVGNKSPVASW